MCKLLRGSTSGVKSAPEKLTKLRERTGLSKAKLSKKLGYSFASGYQRFEDPEAYTKPYLPLELVQKLAKELVGLGDPPVTMDEIYDLAGVAKGTQRVAAIKQIAEQDDNVGPSMTLPAGYAAIPVADARAGMGGPGAILSEQPIAYRYFPEEELRALRVKPENLWAHRADGESMAPDFQDGDLLIVDTSQRNPTPPRIFTIWDGFGLVTKYVERVIGSDPPRVRLIASNPKFPLQELTIGDRGELDGEEAFIVGRVVFVQRAL